MASLPPPLSPPARWREEHVALPRARARHAFWSRLYRVVEPLGAWLFLRATRNRVLLWQLESRRRNRRDQEECFGHVKWESGVSHG